MHFKLLIFWKQYIHVYNYEPVLETHIYHFITWEAFISVWGQSDIVRLYFWLWAYPVMAES